MIKELLFPEISSRYTALVASGVPPSRAYSIAFDQAIAALGEPTVSVPLQPTPKELPDDSTGRVNNP